jgi:hypothetical protein
MCFEPGFVINPMRRAVQAVALHEKNTTLAELMGMRMAHTIGCKSPAAAMLTPTTL